MKGYSYLTSTSSGACRAINSRRFLSCYSSFALFSLLNRGMDTCDDPVWKSCALRKQTYLLFSSFPYIIINLPYLINKLIYWSWIEGQSIFNLSKSMISNSVGHWGNMINLGSSIVEVIVCNWAIILLWLRIQRNQVNQGLSFLI